MNTITALTLQLITAIQIESRYEKDNTSNRSFSGVGFLDADGFAFLQKRRARYHNANRNNTAKGECNNAAKNNWLCRGI